MKSYKFILLFLLISSQAHTQNSVCFQSMGCDARGLYVTLGYSCDQICVADLQFFFYSPDGSSIGGSSSTARYDFPQGQGSKDIILSNSPCGTFSSSSLQITNWSINNPGNGSVYNIKNGVCVTNTGNPNPTGCCLTPIPISNVGCTLSATYIATPATCGSSGNINLIVRGGSPPYTYSWSDGTVTGNNSIDRSPGTYSVLIEDTGGNCLIGISQIVISNNCVCNLAVTSTTRSANCFGGFNNGNGSASVTATGGPTPGVYKYLWNNGATTSTINAPPGAYSVTVSDIGGYCSISKNNIVIEESNLHLNATSQPRTCGAPYGTASVNVTGGTSPYIYQWNTGETTSSILKPPGNYTIQVIDFKNCSATKNIVIEDGCVCNLSLTATKGSETGCPSNPIAEYAILLQAINGGIAPFNYKLSSTSVNSTFTPQIQNSSNLVTIWTIPPGKYLIEVEDAAHCKKSLPFEYIENCPIDCTPHIDNCRTEWQQFLLKTYANGQCKVKIWETDCNTTSAIRRNGKVAIGPNLTTIPDGFNLAVQGGVIANEVKVKLCSNGTWCDYVFDKKYRLMPLLEVDNYIQQNKRLPNMPSTSDIEKEGGYEIKKLTLLQQEKIEEAYLHLIELEEKVKGLQTKIDNNKKRNNRISQLLK